jgi:phage terminase large subunit-like protein
MLEDVPGALWNRGVIEATRASRPPSLIRVVVAIDPAASSTAGADETGIIVVGKDEDGRGWVIADASGRYPPTEWAKTAISAYRAHRADRIVAEVNNGGDMVEATLRMIEPNASFAGVRASRGKVTRLNQWRRFTSRTGYAISAYFRSSRTKCARLPLKLMQLLKAARRA